MAVVRNNLLYSQILCFGWQFYLEGRFNRRFRVDVHFDPQTFFYFARILITREPNGEAVYVFEQIDERTVMEKGWTAIYPSDETIAKIMLLIG
ncbi:hypothetical protein EVB41_065 [Rhizobium phage RHph_TM3_14A]|nr:hypothetical protein EVB29_065 [Rhizobium phage RHph_TM27A]QIG66985.1 hypothetical protein EVB30_065 [Rhizobium phage RHph_TM27B]QIG67074.1 hypothetical protein EVB31_064 [Rhizobium phage RHph_TM29]QIG67530.1 hypothetical protein EVB41_065 [Rhizobium phage RHph_TM3_14A]